MFAADPFEYGLELETFTFGLFALPIAGMKVVWKFEERRGFDSAAKPPSLAESSSETVNFPSLVAEAALILEHV